MIKASLRAVKKALLFGSPVLAVAGTLAWSAPALAQAPAPAPAPPPAAVAPPPAAAAPAAGAGACPPGSWFCADTQAQSAAPAGQPVQPLQQLPSNAPPPVVVYQPPSPVVIVNAPRRDVPPVYYYAPRVAYPNKNEWGLNLHLEGAMMGGGKSHDAGMGGIGFGLRYKPIPALGIEANLDFAGGRDYNGMRRNETAFTINGLVFLNPKSKLQVYLLAGFGWSGAHVVNDNRGYDSAKENFGYFGGQAGAGLEWRISRHFALNADLRGFIRGRIDDSTHSNPEFYNPISGRTTNTSGGGLITGGMTFYF